MNTFILTRTQDMQDQQNVGSHKTRVIEEHKVTVHFKKITKKKNILRDEYFKEPVAKSNIVLACIRAVTIHQTHDSVRITIFDPRFGSYHDFFGWGGRKKKERFLKQYFLLNNILKIFINWTPKNKINYANY